MNIIVICLDTFRADIIDDRGALAEIQTPAMDRLAAQSANFDRAFGESQPTLQARRSVMNSTREDGEGLLKVAGEIPIETAVKTFPLEEANEALLQVKECSFSGAAVPAVATGHERGDDCPSGGMRMNRPAAALTIITLTATICVAQEPPETLLRHDNFLVFAGHAGGTITIEIESIRKAGYVYADDVMVEVIDPSSERALRELVPLGETASIEYAVAVDGNHAVRISAGWNVARTAIEGAPWALVAWKNVPINICGAMAPMYFKVPPDVQQFSVALSASVTGEGAELTILGPDGKVVAREIGDFDTLQTVTVDVPDGADDAIWQMRLTDPDDPALNLDDVQLYLAGRVPPFLSSNSDDIEVFAAGEQYQPDLIDQTVPMPGRFSLGAGESATVAWQMPALPEGKVYALRIAGTDVDYPKELMLSINGGEPIAVPVGGNAVTETFTLHISREMLRVGENTMVLTQDPSGGSNTVVASEMQILIGDRIREFRGY